MGLSLLFSVDTVHHLQNGSSSYKDRQESCQAYHREILHSIDVGFPCQQTYLRGNCHHPQQTPQKQDRWFRHPFDEASSTQDCTRYFHQTAREERERRDNYVPETSVLDIDTIEIDVETKDMLKMLELGNIPKLQVVNPKADMGHGHPPRR